MNPRIAFFAVLMLLCVPVFGSTTVLVEDFFADGETTQGADPLDVNWIATGGLLQVVQDAVLNPVAPHNVAELFINAETAEKDEYLSFRLPAAVELEVGQALQVSFDLRFVDGLPRVDASRTGVSLAMNVDYPNRLSPWSDPGNREYAFFTSFGHAGTRGFIVKTEGVQFLNSAGSSLHSVNLANDPGSVFFEVAKVAAGQIRVRYRLNDGPPQEFMDEAATFHTFNQIHLRYRRATTEPLERLRISGMRVVLTDADLTERGPVTWWVAPSGDDGHTGEEPDAAFATISRAILWAQAGDTIIVREGVYPEALQFSRSGTETAPITVQAYEHNGIPESVIVRGFDSFTAGQNGVDGWMLHEGNIWKIQLPSGFTQPVGRNLVMVDGEALIPARWPNATAPVDFDRRRMAEAIDGSLDLDSAGTQPPYSQQDFYTGTYRTPDMATLPEGAFTGAHIDLCPGHNWWHKTGVVTGNSGDTITFRFRYAWTWREDLDKPKQKDRFAVWGHIATLDTPGEFFIDANGINGPARMLYVWLPDSGTPHNREWALLRRATSISTGNNSHITVKNIEVQGGAVTTGAQSHNNVFDGVEVSFGAINRNLLIFAANIAVDLQGSNHTFRNGRVRYTDGRSIRAHTSGHQIHNSIMHDSTSHLISLDTAIAADVRWNTAFNGGDTAVAMGAKASYIAFNHVYHAGMRITDIALMNTWNSGDMQGTEIAYNYAHTNLAPWDESQRWWGGQGIRLDSGEAPRGCSNALIHHNVVWNTTSASGITAWGLEEGMDNFGDSRIFIYQNTIDSLLVLGGRGSNAGTIAERNIARGFNNAVGNLIGASVADNFFAESTVADNLTGDIGYVSPGNRNYQLRPSSPARDVGTPVENITEPGPYAYLGAYNPAAQPWRPGARIRFRDLPDLHAFIEQDGLGIWWLVVDNAPIGRTFPDTFTVQLGSSQLSDPLVTYHFETHRTCARFVIPHLPDAATAQMSVSLDGETFIVPHIASVSVPRPQAGMSEPVITAPSGGTTVQVQISNIVPQPFVRFPLAFSGLTSHDFSRDAVPWLVDTRSWQSLGMRPDGGDLRFFAADGITPLRFHVEHRLGIENTLIWLLQDNAVTDLEPIANFTDQTIIYVAFGDGMTLQADDPSVLTDSFPALGFENILLHLRATDTGHTPMANGTPLTAWPDASPNAFPVIADPSTAPTWQANSSAGLPAIAFNGTNQHMLVNGAAGLGTGASRFFTVYRNPDPGDTNWQRLLSGRTDTNMSDWQQGFAAIVNAYGEEDGDLRGKAIPRHDPHILDTNATNTSSSRKNFTIGKRALGEEEKFRGEIAEIIGFDGGLVGAPRDALLRYLRRKHNIIARPEAAFVAEEALPAFSLSVGGVAIHDFHVDASGHIHFELPDLGELHASPVAMDITLDLNDGTSLTLHNAVWVGTDGDVWRMQQFGPQALLASDTMANGSHWLADPDGDGIVNLLEFAFGTDPLDAASRPALSLERSGHSFTLHHPPARPETTITLKVSNDMEHWREADPDNPADSAPAPNQPLFWRLKVDLID